MFFKALCVTCMAITSNNLGMFCVSADFIEVFSSSYFVDKTPLIKTILDREVVVVAAPGGFGKSTNLDMVRMFLSNTVHSKSIEKIFQNTSIFKEEKIVKTHLGAHPVINCSFNIDSPITNYDSMVTFFRRMLHNTFMPHQYLKDSKRFSQRDILSLSNYLDKDTNELPPFQISAGLYFLAEILIKHHEQEVIIIIDDYDKIMLDSVFHQGLNLSEVIEFHNRFYGDLLSQKKLVKKALIAGNTCLLLKFLPNLKGLSCIKFLQDDAFQPFFGLTEAEIDTLLKKKPFDLLQGRKTELAMWYNGYTDPGLAAHIFNTKSVTSFLRSGDMLCFWNTSSDANAFKVLQDDSVSKQLFSESADKVNIVTHQLRDISINHLQELKNMFLQISWNKNLFDLYVQLLLEKGYFTLDLPSEKNDNSGSITVKIPNIEICEAIRQILTAEVEKMKQNMQSKPV